MADDKTRILKPQDLERLAAAADTSAGQTTILTPEQMARIGAAARATDRPAAAPAAARRSASRPPQFDGERIIFFCPNGHRLIVAAAHAGRRGRCDKAGCGVPVVIPVPPVVPGSVPEAETAVPSPETEPPAVVPGEAAVEASPPELPFELTVAEGAAGGEEGGAAPVEPPPAPGEAPVMDKESEEELIAGEVFEEAVARGEDNLPALLMSRLWLETRHSQAVQVELHLSNGSVLRPTEYDPRWSRGKMGLFAATAVDGTVTITAVAWDSIQRIVVLKVDGRPPDMFQRPVVQQPDMFEPPATA